MTLNGFLKVLRQTPRTWRQLRPGPSLRCRRGDCPLVAVQRRLGHRLTWGPIEAAEFLGLAESLAVQIAKASDGEMRPTAKMVQLLYQACGVKTPR